MTPELFTSIVLGAFVLATIAAVAIVFARETWRELQSLDVGLRKTYSRLAVVEKQIANLEIAFRNCPHEVP